MVIRLRSTAVTLFPFFVDEVLPGDTMNLNARMLARMNSMIYPIMDNVFLDTMYFFVPTRLVWENWERFNGSQDNPDDPIDYEVPTLSSSGAFIFQQGTIYDYMGLPTKVDMAVGERVNALPLRCYNLIWNEWFRDENLQDAVTFSIDDGPDDIQEYSILRRGKRHDYFTSCLPWAQKGDAVVLPLGTSAPVIGDGSNVSFFNGTADYALSATDNTGFNGHLQIFSSGTTGTPGSAPTGTAMAGDLTLGLSTDPTRSGMIADLSGATAATVGELREAIAFQHILERDARGGTRYTEMLRAHWGVAPRDDRLQRPEYLGGSSERINVSAVAQTTASPGSPTLRDSKGGLAAYATGAGRSGFMKSFPEYGYVIGLVNVRSDITYQQGMRKMWSRSTRFDFALPDLMHLGEQPVLQKEIFYVDNGATADTVFGYQERFAEYRYFPSQVTGPFRSNYTGTLDAWHLATNFASAPTLDTSFIQDSPPLDRVLAVPSEPNVLLDCYIELKHARCMPVYAIRDWKGYECYRRICCWCG